jgi:DNA polymerase elongation subunit (family B)
MYQAIAYQRKDNTVHIWDDVVGHRKINYKPYAYRKHPYGQFVTLDGTRVEKVVNPNRNEGEFYEIDVKPEIRTLIDLYGDSDEPSVGHRTIFLDIEIDISTGYATAESAENPITAIALFDQAGNRRIVTILDPNRTVQEINNNEYQVIPCQTEYELLSKFLCKYYEIRPTIITGWNIDSFDIPYLYRRMIKVLGNSFADTLSPIKQIEWNMHRSRYSIAGVSCLDYMALYKNFTYSEESSYALEAISQKELGRGKIKFEGNLDHLMRTDIQKYIDYNMNDVDLVYELDQKMKLLDLARGICHKGHVPYEDVYYSTRYLDGASLTYLKRLNIVAPSRKPHESDEPLDLLGAYVKPPIPGKYEWVYDLDLTSLYPSLIMTLNISPETKIGLMNGFDGNKFVKGEELYMTLVPSNKGFTTDTLKQWLIDNKYSIAANGVVYDTKIKGFIPSILERWFADRVELKNLRKKAEKDKDSAKAEYFDRMQLVTKIMLNSFYGALGNAGFRFFDPDNATAVTSSGQQLIKFTADVANNYYKRELGIAKDYNIYIDTDSVFYSSLPLIEHRYKEFDKTDEKWMSERTIEIASEVRDFINKSYNVYAPRFHNVDSHRFDIKQEFVAKAGLWIAKKRYAQWLINQEGHTISKLDVKGLDVVRSSFPPAFRKFMAEILEDILKNTSRNDIDEKIVNFRNHIKTLDPIQIMSPIGVKEVSKWTTNSLGRYISGTPVHVKSALNYNALLKHFNVTSVRDIIDGEKIRWTYLKANPYGLEQLALKGFDDPEPIRNLVTQYIDHDKIFDSAFTNKLNDFYEALAWGKVPENMNLNQFFSFG